MQTNGELVPSLSRVQRTLATDISYTISRMRVLERLPGNPIGIGYRWVDETTVALAARLPPFCRVVGLRAGHEAEIEPIVSWYRDRGVKPAFEMVPGHYGEDLGLELARLGFFQSRFHVSLVAAAVPVETETRNGARFNGEVHDGFPLCETHHADHLVIEPVVDAKSMEAYLDAYVSGWEIAVEDRGQFKANVRPWLNQPGWSLYVGRAKGKPAAAATLYLHDGVGYLADAATHPAYRGQGFQSALLRRRISDARASGADLVFSGAPPFSTSHRNMERTGMRVQFFRSLWTPV
jgi:ribosomal protein S18 acetylase RimI-like enzyme